MRSEIQVNIIEGYQVRLKQLDDLYLKTYKSFLDIQTKNQNWLINSDKRIAIYTLYISIIFNTKTNLFLLHKFLNTEDWESIYFNEVIFLNSKDKYYAYLKDLDTDYRFLFFHQSFSQFENYIRILHKVLNIEKVGDPLKIVELFIPSYNEFIDSIETVRNSIHNNGFYKPIKKQPKSVKIKLKSEYTINSGEQVYLDWDNAFFVFENIINCINELNDIKEIKSIVKI